MTSLVAKTPEQTEARVRRDRLLAIAQTTEDAQARRLIQEQAERESIVAGERRIYVEPWTASLRVRISPRDPRIEQVLLGMDHLEIVDVLPDVTLEQGDDSLWYLTDGVHEATRERALLVMTEDQVVALARRVLERYYRLAIPLRLAQTAQLTDVLDVLAFGAEGQAYEADEVGAIDVRDGSLLSVRVANRGLRTLHVYALNVASSGRCQVLGCQALDSGAHHRFGGTWKLRPGRARTFAIDRFVVLGTTSSTRDLGCLLQNDPFVDLLYPISVRGGDAQPDRSPPAIEAWAACNLTFRISS